MYFKCGGHENLFDLNLWLLAKTGCKDLGLTLTYFLNQNLFQICQQSYSPIVCMTYEQYKSEFPPKMYCC